MLIKLNVFYNLSKEKSFFKHERKMVWPASSKIMQGELIKNYKNIANNKIISKKESFFQYLFVQSILNTEKIRLVNKNFLITELDQTFEQNQTNFNYSSFDKDSNKLKLSDYLDTINPEKNKLNLRNYSKINSNFFRESILRQNKIFINYKKPFISYWLLPLLGLIGLVPTFSVPTLQSHDLNTNNNSFRIRNISPEKIILKNNINKDISNNYYFQINKVSNHPEGVSTCIIKNNAAAGIPKGFMQAATTIIQVEELKSTQSNSIENQFIKYKEMLDELFLSSLETNKKKSRYQASSSKNSNFDFSRFSLAILNLKQNCNYHSNFNWYWSNLNQYLNKNLISSIDHNINCNFPFENKTVPSGLPACMVGSDHAAASLKIMQLPNKLLPIGTAKNFILNIKTSKILPLKKKSVTFLNTNKKSNLNLFSGFNCTSQTGYNTCIIKNNAAEAATDQDNLMHASPKYFIGIINDKTSQAKNQNDLINIKSKMTPYKSIKKALLLMDEIIFNGPETSRKTPMDNVLVSNKSKQANNIDKLNPILSFILHDIKAGLTIDDIDNNLLNTNSYNIKNNEFLEKIIQILFKNKKNEFFSKEILNTNPIIQAAPSGYISSNNQSATSVTELNSYFNINSNIPNNSDRNNIIFRKDILYNYIFEGLKDSLKTILKNSEDNDYRLEIQTQNLSGLSYDFNIAAHPFGIHTRKGLPLPALKAVRSDKSNKLEKEIHSTEQLVKKNNSLLSFLSCLNPFTGLPASEISRRDTKLNLFSVRFSDVNNPLNVKQQFSSEINYFIKNKNIIFKPFYLISNSGWMAATNHAGGSKTNQDNFKTVNILKLNHPIRGGWMAATDHAGGSKTNQKIQSTDLLHNIKIKLDKKDLPAWSTGEALFMQEKLKKSKDLSTCIIKNNAAAGSLPTMQAATFLFGPSIKIIGKNSDSYIVPNNYSTISRQENQIKFENNYINVNNKNNSINKKMLLPISIPATTQSLPDIQVHNKFNLKNFRNKNSFLFLNKYVNFLSINIKKNLSPYKLRLTYFPELKIKTASSLKISGDYSGCMIGGDHAGGITKVNNKLFKCSRIKEKTSSGIEGEKIFLSYLSKVKKSSKSNFLSSEISKNNSSRFEKKSKRKSLVHIDKNFDSVPKYFNLKDLKLKSKLSLKKKIYTSKILKYKINLIKQKNVGASNNRYKNISETTCIIKNNAATLNTSNLKIFISKKINFLKLNQSNKVTLAKKLIDILSKKQTLKIKRRLKKMKKETRRRKKRKIFYPRPKWITFSLYRNFLNNRYNVESQNLYYQNKNLSYPIINPYSIVSKPSGASTIKKVGITSFVTNQKSCKPIIVTGLLKKHQKLNEGQTKDFYRTSSTVFFDLKRILMKSNWLRNYLNPYFEKVKNIYRDIETSSKKIEIYLRIRNFLLNFYGFERTIPNLSQFSSGIIFNDAAAGLNNSFNSKIQDRFNIIEYNRIIYQRFQRIILSIKDNLNLNGEIKNRSKKLGKNIRPFIKRDYKSNDSTLNQPGNPNQKPSFWSKFIKNTVLKINTYTSYGYTGVSHTNTLLNVPKNNLFWALNKTNISASGTIENYYNFRKKLWETYKIREVSKSNKTKKIIYNLFNKYGLNNLGGSNRSKSLEGFNHILEHTYKNNIFLAHNKINQISESSNDFSNSFNLSLSSISEPQKTELSYGNKSLLLEQNQVIDEPAGTAISLNNYIFKSEQKLTTIENKLKLLGLYSKKIEKTYKNSYFRSLKQQLINPSYHPTYPEGNVGIYDNSKKIEMSKMSLAKILKYSKLFEKNNINSFSTLNNYHKISNNYSYWWASSPLQYLSNILPACMHPEGIHAAAMFKDYETSNFVSIKKILSTEPITRASKYLKLELFSSEIIFSLLFHFCTLVSFISLGGIRSLIKFYYILISKTSKLITHISFIELFRPSIFLNNLSGLSLRDRKDKNNGIKQNTRLASGSLLTGSSMVAADIAEELKENKFIELSSNLVNSPPAWSVATMQPPTQLRLLFFKYIIARNQITKLKKYNDKLNISDFNLNGIKEDNINKITNIDLNKAYIYLKIIKSKILDSTLSLSLASHAAAVNYLNDSKQSKIIKNKEVKQNANGSMLVLNKYKFNLVSLVLFKTSTFFYSFYKIKFYTYFFLLKAIDLFALPISFIYKFFEKPGEYVVENLAYNFLVEWSSDLITTIPETFDMNSYSYISKFNRNITPIILFYTTFGLPLSSFLKEQKKNLYFDSFLWTIPFAITNSILKRVLNSTLLVFVQQLYEPDIDSIIREKKGIIFWDIWGESLKQIAEENSINIYELTTDKEEQIKLLSKYADVLSFSNGFSQAKGIDNKKFKSEKTNLQSTSLFFLQNCNTFETNNKDFIFNESSVYRTNFIKPIVCMTPKGIPTCMVGSDHAATAASSKIKSFKGYKTTPINSSKDNMVSKKIQSLKLLVTKNKNKINLPTWSEATMQKIKKKELSIIQMNRSSFPLKLKKLALLFDISDSSHGLAIHDRKSYNNSNFGWAASQFLSYQGKDTDLFIDLHPPKSFWSIPSMKYAYSIQQPIGSIVCQIFSGIFYKQISKNILVVGSASLEKSILIQAMAGETELKMITDNANRYAMVYRGVAVGIKLLRDVFEALSVHTPCIFLLEDIHIIGERRPFLIDNGESDDTSYNKNQSMQGILLKEKSSGSDGSREVLYRSTKHLLSHYKKPYKEPKSLATNHFSFTFLFSNSPSQKGIKTRDNFFKPGGAALPIQVIKKENESKYKISNSNSTKNNNQNNYFFGSLDPFNIFSHPFGIGEKKNISTASPINENYSEGMTTGNDGIQKKIKYSSSLELKTDNSQSLSPPSSSPFNVLVLKEEKKLKHKKLIKEIPWFGLPGEQFSLISKYNYSTRIKIALLADLVLSNLSVKLDMITDLLVIIDSVKGNRGFVVFATTHIPSILDPALRRPGRFDETINLPIVSTLFSRWSNYRYNIKFLSSYLYQKANYCFNAPLASTFSKGVTIDLFKSNLIIYDNNILNQTSNELINYINKKNSISSKKLNFLLSDISHKPEKNKAGQFNILYDNKRSEHFLSADEDNSLDNDSFPNNLSESSEAASILLSQGAKIHQKGRSLVSFKNKQFLRLKAKNYSFACKSLISLLLFSSNSSLKWISIVKDSNIFIDDYSLYLTMFGNPLMLKIVLMSMIGGKIGESFVLNSSCAISLKREKESSLNSKIDNKNLNKIESLNSNNYNLENRGSMNPTYKIENEFLFDFDNTWRQASSLLLSYLQKRQCAILNKNIALCGYSKGINKLLSFNNKYSLMEAPSPPITNILLPAKRYENYKKTFNNQYPGGSNKQGVNLSGSLLEKLQFHQQQRLLRRLYKYPVKEFFKSEILTNSKELFKENLLNYNLETDLKESKNYKQSNFNSAYLTLAPLEKMNGNKHLINLSKISSTNWCYKNILYNRHRTYLTNQWWNGQQGEHNAETTFLSDIDWRYTFVESIGDINIDFPDAEQFYNPRNRRWFIDRQDEKWTYWFNIQSEYKDVYSHYIYECFTKVFKFLNENREIIDFYAEMLHQIPSTPNSSTQTGLNERELLNIYKRFYGSNSL